MTSPRVVVVDHHDSYTWNLVHLIAGVTGALPTVLQHDETDAATVLGFDFVVLSPGPGHPGNRADFSVGNDVLLAGTKPVLGVCLGMQGLVTAYGGTVDREVPAHGDVALINHNGEGLFRGLPQDFRAVRYHSLAVLDLPDSLEATAACPGPSEDGPWVCMGVRHTSLPLSGVQFHPESVLSEYGARLVANFLEQS